MTHIESIEYYKKKFNKVVSFHGLDSDHTAYAFFLMQAAIMGMPSSDLFDWATGEVNRVREITLEQL